MEVTTPELQIAQTGGKGQLVKVVLSNGTTFLLDLGDLTKYTNGETVPVGPETKKLGKDNRESVTTFLTNVSLLEYATVNDYDRNNEYNQLIKMNVDSIIQRHYLTFPKLLFEEEKDWKSVQEELYNLFWVPGLEGGDLLNQGKQLYLPPEFTDFTTFLNQDASLGLKLPDGSPSQLAFKATTNSGNSIRAFHYKDVSYLPLFIGERKRFAGTQDSKKSGKQVSMYPKAIAGEDSRLESYYVLRWIQKLFKGVKNATVIGVGSTGPCVEIFESTIGDNNKFKTIRLFSADLSLYPEKKKGALQGVFNPTACTI